MKRVIVGTFYSSRGITWNQKRPRTKLVWALGKIDTLLCLKTWKRPTSWYEAAVIVTGEIHVYSENGSDFNYLTLAELPIKLFECLACGSNSVLCRKLIWADVSADYGLLRYLKSIHSEMNYWFSAVISTSTQISQPLPLKTFPAKQFVSSLDATFTTLGKYLRYLSIAD